MPWIDPMVKNYAENVPKNLHETEARLCCLAPGDCSSVVTATGCPLGHLTCKIGNSRYACSFFLSAAEPRRCYQEGTLAHTRNITCCQSNLVDYLKTQTCTGGFASPFSSSYCCTGDDVASCTTGNGCPAIPINGNSYYCIGGMNSTICTGLTDELVECATEIGLVSEISPDCMSMTFPPFGCALGGSGPPLPSTTRSSATRAPTPTGPVELPKSAGGKNMAKKWLAVSLVAPALLQLVFL
ncbi:hypothetical protein BGZ74_001735 [Mortierella antarctica]|nr:hypothetical protein BGZ74_001735 [Mortierella antarctica]